LFFLFILLADYYFRKKYFRETTSLMCFPEIAFSKKTITLRGVFCSTHNACFLQTFY